MRSLTREFELVLSRGPVRGDSCASVPGDSCTAPLPAGPPAGTLDLNELLHGNALFWNPYALDHMMVLSDEGGLRLAPCCTAMLAGQCCTVLQAWLCVRLLSVLNASGGWQ